MAKENKKINLTMGAIISIIAVLIVGEKYSPQGSKFDILEYYLKKDYPNNTFQLFNHKTKHFLKLARGAYKTWHRRVFDLNNSEKVAEIRKICEKAAKLASPEFTNLKNEINRFLVEDDCVLTEPIAYTCTICSMLHLAVEYCELCQKQTDSYGAYWQTFQNINPRQLFQNTKNIYEGLPMPDGLDVMDSERIINAMDKLAEKIYAIYIANFTD
jgi:hypothetical protein